MATEADPRLTLRFSTLMRRLRASGNDSLAENLESDFGSAGYECDAGHDVEDPIVALVDRQVIVACPYCSGAEIRAAWERDGGEDREP